MVEPLNTALQENLITILAHDADAGRLVARMVDPFLFEGEYREIVKRCLTYWQRHDEPPGFHVWDLFDDIISDPHNRKGTTYTRILRMIDETAGAMNTDYVLDQLKVFTRLQSMKGAILEAAEKLNQRQQMAIEEVETLLGNLLRARSIEFDPGLSLSQYETVLSQIGSRTDEFTTGIPFFDRKAYRPERGVLGLLVGPSGKGKTWWLIHLGKANLLRRKSVLHISLEMNAAKLAQRYYQSMFGVPKRRVPEGFPITLLERTKKGFLKDFGEDVAEPDFAFNSKEIRAELQTRITQRPGMFDKLRIKQFPPRSLTPDGLRAYLDNLEATERFVPDLLLVDYPAIMHIDRRDVRGSIGHNILECRAIAVERDIAVEVVHQSSKEGAKSRQVEITHVAEDWSVIHHADNVITYSSSREEEERGLARLWVGKAREEEAAYGAVITQSYAIGQFCLDAERIGYDYWDLVDRFAHMQGRAGDSEEEEEDE